MSCVSLSPKKKNLFNVINVASWIWKLTRPKVNDVFLYLQSGAKFCKVNVYQFKIDSVLSGYKTTTFGPHSKTNYNNKTRQNYFNSQLPTKIEICYELTLLDIVRCDHKLVGWGGSLQRGGGGNICVSRWRYSWWQQLSLPIHQYRLLWCHYTGCLLKQNNMFLNNK